MNVTIRSGDYLLSAEPGREGGWGIAVSRMSVPEALTLYRTERPVILILKDYAAKHLEFESAYASVQEEDGALVAKGTVTTPLGSRFLFTDTYAPDKENVFAFHRVVTVENAQKNDLGFGSRVALGLLQDQDP